MFLVPCYIVVTKNINLSESVIKIYLLYMRGTLYCTASIQTTMLSVHANNCHNMCEKRKKNETLCMPV